MEHMSHKTLSITQVRRAKSSVAPILNTKWGQGNPFNALLHYSIGGNSYEFVTGCVATAMAQVMKHYNYPSKGTGSVSYVVWNYMANMNHSFEDSYYDWNNMLDVYNYQEWGSLRPTTIAVATLMRDCGMAVKMNYGTQSIGSGANSENIVPALKEHFLYDDATQYYRRSDYEKNDWMEMIYNELSENRPIIYTGVDNSDPDKPSGHAFILHGYNSSGDIYVNWGWEGYCDGYYDIDLLNPDTNQFSEDQDMIFVVPGETCSLTLTASGNGSIIYDDAIVRNKTLSYTIEKGRDATLSISPDMGYSIKSVIINGTDVTSSLSDNQYEIKSIQTDTSIEVEFNNESSYPKSEYNQYITCVSTSLSKVSFGSYVKITLSFEVSNSGNSDVFINKIVAKDPDTKEILFTLTDSAINGLLQGNSNKTHTIELSQDISMLPEFEMEYNWNSIDYAYDSSQNHILTIQSNDYGFIKFADITIGSIVKKFSIGDGDNVSLVIEPKDDCVFRKLIVQNIDVTTDVSNNCYTIENITSNISVKAVFDSNSEDNPTIDGYKYIDLGLSSGKCWSPINYGASNPEDYGLYNGDYIDVEDYWGENWRKPTKEEFQELIDECVWTWTELNGTKGFDIKGPSGRSIFLPAAGLKKSFGYSEVGTTAYYLTSSKDSYIYTWILQANSASQKLTSKYITTESYTIRPILNITKEPILYNLVYMVDGEVYKTYEVKPGDTITPEPSPEKEGYTFSGWSNIPETMPTHDVTITGSFSVNSYELTYMVDGEIYMEQNIDFGTTITPGWSEIPETMPAHDVTIAGSFSVNSYKLTYIVDGEVYKEQSIDFGAKIMPEPAPTKEGHTFSGWSEIPETMPAHDVTIAGSFSVNSYKLTYIVDGEVYKEQSIDFGAKITPEPAPSKEGHTFSGWSEIPETMPAHDVTITGIFHVNSYKLTYMVDGEIYMEQNIDFGTTITPAPAPTKEGYIFSGWSEIPYKMPAHDVMVTGTFSANLYVLTYIVDGQEYKTYDVPFGTQIVPEEEPVKEGYTFSGWSEIPEIMPAHTVIVTGTFTANKYLLTYLLNSEVYKVLELELGTAITPEPAPEREGHTFSGWSEIPEIMPAHDVMVTGTLTVNKYILTYIVDGKEYKTFELDYGTAIIPEEYPVKEGYTFSGWSEIPETMPAHIVIVTGAFSINQYELTYMIGGEIYKRVTYEFGATITPEPIPDEGYVRFEWIDVPETMPAHDVVVYADYETGIAEIMAAGEVVDVYTTTGLLVRHEAKSLKGLRQGVYILRPSNNRKHHGIKVHITK